MLRLPIKNTLDKEMKMEHWNEAKIKDFAEVKGGKRLPKGKQLIKEHNSHPYIRIRDLGKTKYLQLNSEYEYVDDETQQSIARYIVNKGDILISVVGTIGLIGIVGETLDKANQTENCDKIINIKNVLPEYLYYYLISSFGQNEIRKGTVGAVQPKLPLKNVQDITIFYPSIDEQERIVNILSSVDKKIKMNNAINKNLEQQAMTIFNNAIEQSKSITYVELGSLADIKGGKRLPKGANLISTPNSHPYIRVRDLHDVVFVSLSANYEYVDDETQKTISRYITTTDDVLVSIVGTIGLTAIVDKSLNMANLTENCIKITDLHGISPEYLLLFLRSQHGSEEIRKGTVGAVQAKLPIKNIQTLSVPLLPQPDLQSLNDTLKALFNQLSIHVAESKCLTDIRDSLLPKLMSGELDVSNLDL